MSSAKATNQILIVGGAQSGKKHVHAGTAPPPVRDPRGVLYVHPLHSFLTRAHPAQTS